MVLLQGLLIFSPDVLPFLFGVELFIGRLSPQTHRLAAEAPRFSCTRDVIVSHL